MAVIAAFWSHLVPLCKIIDQIIDQKSQASIQQIAFV